MTKTPISGTIKTIGNVTYEIIPTEKGYGYIISIALSICIIVLYSYMNSIGMLYNDFLNDIGGGIRGLTLIIGINNFFMSFSGLFTNIALKKFSFRQVGMFGACLYTFGWFFTSFVQSVPQIAITYGFMQGVGTGIVFTIAFASYGSYFVSQKKVTVLNFCQLFICSSSMLLPLLVEKLLKEYGYRGTILILSAIVAHCIFAVICMHPVEWHSEMRLLYKTVNTCEEIVINETNNKSDEIKAKFTVKRVEDASLEGPNEKVIKPKGKLVAIAEFLDLTLLKDIFFVNMMVGLTVGMLVDVSFFSIFPSHLYDLKYDTEKVAKLLSFLGATDVLGRVFLFFFSKYYNVRSEVIFYFGVLLSTIVRFFIFFCESYYPIMAITCILGFLRALIQNPYSLVYQDYNPEKFPAALALGMLLYGTLSLTGLYFIGKIHDMTGNHYVGYMILILFSFICIIPWTIKLWYFRKNVIHPSNKN